MFAAINGPQQLYKHKLLFNYFLVTLSNPDEGIAQLALRCFLKFKPNYAVPYAEYLSSLLKKKEFRDTLTMFDLSKKEGTVDSQHRHELIPVIVRILFGRFSSRGTGAKSSKDSPQISSPRRITRTITTHHRIKTYFHLPTVHSIVDH